MPAFVFTGLVETAYPFDRDAEGRPVGAVQPGDVRDLDEPLDWQWAPAGDGGAGGEQAGPAEDPAGVSETGGPAAPAPVPDGPQPAPPAVIPAGPQPFAVTTDQQ